MNKTSETKARIHAASETETDADRAARAWSAASIVAAVVVVIAFTALWIEQLIAPAGVMRALF